MMKYIKIVVAALLILLAVDAYGNGPSYIDVIYSVTQSGDAIMKFINESSQWERCLINYGEGNVWFIDIPPHGQSEWFLQGDWEC